MKEQLLKPEVSFFLSILIPLLILATTWGIFSSRLDNVEELAQSNQAMNKQQTQVNMDINVKLAEIQKDILYIRKQLDKEN